MYSQTLNSEIKKLLSDIMCDVIDFSDESQGFFYDYIGVKKLLEQAKAHISETLGCQNPEILDKY